MSTIREFKWLHLSDLHVGMTDQDWLWPTLKHSLFSDMEVVFSAVGGCDLVIFSGDLTQRGTPDEFEKLGVILSELWAKFKSWGFLPKLIVLPGNHDIQRASPLPAELRVLRKWWDEIEIHSDFFSADTGSYRAAISTLFDPYSKWVSSELPDIELLSGKPGMLPGDASYVVENGGLKVGLVALNSTWLQIDGSDYDKKLHVDTKQLLSVTDSDPYTWCSKNDFNIIVTHHPTSWLHQNSAAYWLSDINPSGRFDVHLFGHLHEPKTETTSIAGSLPKTSIQGASMFGLAYTKEGVERIHGYSVARLSVQPNQMEVKIWPRKLRTLENGERKLGPDVKFDLAPDNSATILLRSLERTSALVEEQFSEKVTLGAIAEQSREILQKIRYQIPLTPAHANVRKIEQRRLLEILSDKSAAWIVAEWGMGEDGFLSSICQSKSRFERPVYRLDLTDFQNRQDFLNEIREVLDCSFQQLCEVISQSGDSFLLLDNFPAATSTAQDGTLTDREIEGLIEVVLEYCPNLIVLIRARRSPLSHSFPLVQLKALDEADLRTYVLEHEHGRIEFASPNAVGLLLRHTDGIPTKLDRSLKDLEVITLSELVNTDSDVGQLPVESGDTSPVLARSIMALSANNDAARSRSFSLLKVLSLFPQGEQLSRIKRFHATTPFYPANATELFDEALIEVSTIQGLTSGEAGPSAKTLVVPRPVREYVRDLSDGDEVMRMNRRAAEIYFGQQWSTGTFKFPAAYKFDEPHCSNPDIRNANTIIVRLLKEAINQGEGSQIGRVLALAEFYLRALIRGNHYHSAVIYSDDLVPLIPNKGFGEKRAKIRALYAQGLRMVGEHQKCKSVILEIIDFQFAKEDRQRLRIELALCHQSLNENGEAKRVAEKIIKLDRHSSHGLQARALLIELDTSDPKRTEKLGELEQYCRGQKSNVVANNIALLRARESKGTSEDIRQILLPVVSAKSGKRDYYNETRAAIKLAELSLDEGVRLNDKELNSLIGAYHFLFNERLPGLFDQCHRSLWQTFEIANDIPNLLTLFRHSSLYWRLKGADNVERSYLKKLASRVGNSISQKLVNLSREAAYYLVRASSQNPLQ